MKKATVFHALVKGTSTLVKAYKKANAVARFQMMDASIKASDVSRSQSVNSHQSPVEVEYPEICK